MLCTVLKPLSEQSLIYLPHSLVARYSDCPHCASQAGQVSTQTLLRLLRYFVLENRLGTQSALRLSSSPASEAGHPSWLH